ncbi:MAG: GNAT family N-acetyltransferase [Methylobacteriaceae bacterium]|nr:GNAT family N-acetyltransferase [Methylobacteriaceae bacterium]MBV9246380.1 GNAT family N-acetyltransferase [Methylobacteriaceae bacterium]MBV9635267.1 GNAT family N-acetyltransferase [Methylobacteriaceae bacterium]MBV9703752.1 GNAT family N-acetyltransferase [Methylobacteriaceae bacterium]
MPSFFGRKLVPSIRPLDPEWAADCARLHAPSFGHPWSEYEFERLLAADNTVADGALEAGGRRLLGFVLSRNAGEEAEILTVVVDAATRRRGLGRALVGTHLARLAGLGVKALFLEVEEENRAAIALYAGYDFREVGRRQGYYPKASGEAASAVVMRRDLG